MRPQLLSVNVAEVREIPWRGRMVRTGIWKFPVTGRVAVRGVNVDGDDQADRRVHGGEFQAVYAYAREDYAWWEGELGRELPPGTFGENLTVEGLDPTTARVGEQWRVGSALLEVSLPRIPCFKLGRKMEEPRFLKRFAAARRPGCYFRILEEGDIGAGDPIEVVARPGHDVTIGLLNEIKLHDRSLAVRVAEARDELPAGWLEWVAERG
ncbi:MAG TPA: MOSC domain-containing protein [Thermoleophilaceae bacterium]|nr:MOSC domain-containing protein [Thermoleophilaceae bacterium]